MPDPAAATAAAALADNPFYRSICSNRSVLAQYLDYSIQEGLALGRSVHLSDPTRGVAVWLLPQPAAILSRAAVEKRAFLGATLGADGYANYRRIVDYMNAQTASIIDGDAWYLSILAVDPASQGQGLGRQLLEPTLAEADRASAVCWLETFNPRSIPFYQRCGFDTVAQFFEPTSGSDYTVMVRSSKPA